MSGLSFKNGVIRDGSQILGNIKQGIIRKGTYSTAGSGQIVGNTKNGIIREGSSSVAGSGHIIGNVKDQTVKVGSSSVAGSGQTKGKVKDYSIPGMEREKDEDIVACYHFLVKKFL